MKPAGSALLADVHWWSAIFGLVMLVVPVCLLVSIRRPMHLTKTDLHGLTTEEYRPLSPREQVGLGLFLVAMAAFGGLVLLSAISWTDSRVPDERIFRVFGVGVVAVIFAVTAVVSLRMTFQSRRHAEVITGAQVEDGESPGADEVVIGYIFRTLLSHPIGAALLGVVSTYIAVFAVTLLPAAWRGDTGQFEAAMAWFQPVSALGALMGLGEVTVALILLGLWVVIAVFTGNELSGALTVVLFGIFWLVALVCWPFGLADEWLAWGRGLLSLL